MCEKGFRYEVISLELEKSECFSAENGKQTTVEAVWMNTVRCTPESVINRLLHTLASEAKAGAGELSKAASEF